MTGPKTYYVEWFDGDGYVCRTLLTQIVYRVANDLLFEENKRRALNNQPILNGPEYDSRLNAMIVERMVEGPLRDEAIIYAAQRWSVKEFENWTIRVSQGNIVSGWKKSPKKVVFADRAPLPDGDPLNPPG